MQPVKKVLHLLWDGNLGGVQRYVKQVYSSNYWSGYKHFIFIFTEAGDILNENTQGLTVECAHIHTNKEIFKCRKALKSVLQQYEIDIIHCHCDTLLYLSQLPLYKNYKNIYTEHGDSFVRENRQLLTKILWNTNGRFWDKVILNSNYTQNAFADKYPKLTPKTEVISNPLLDTVKITDRSMNSKLKIGTIGRLAHIKGNDLFLKALPKVIKQYPDLIVEIYGDGEEKEKLQKLATELKLSSNITFQGFTQEPVEKMRTLDCLVVPSRKESFGLVALEALAIGTPVVAFKGTGISDFLEHGKYGYLTEINDLDELSSNIIYILSNRDKWQKFSQDGIAMVKEKYSLEKHIQALKSCYENS